MLVRTSTALCIALLVGAACTTAPKPGEGVDRVESLMGLVQRVHVDSEVAKQKTRQVYATMNSLLAKEYQTEPGQAYRAFVGSLDESERHSEQLKSSVRAMRTAAQTVFEQWDVDLAQIASVTLRERSEARLEATRQRYQALFAAVRGAEVSYDGFHRSMRDLSLFLAHDLNKQAVAEVREDARRIADLVEDLDGRFERSLQAASRYLAAAGAEGTTAQKATPQR